jgi:hypothetical protein
MTTTVQPEGLELTATMLALVIAILRSTRFPLEDEKRLQEAMAAALAARGLACTREVPLSADGAALGVIDLLVAPNVGVEVKIKGGAKDIFRQIDRYALSPALAAIIVATGKPLALPQIIGGKRCVVVNLSRTWL